MKKVLCNIIGIASVLLLCSWDSNLKEQIIINVQDKGNAVSPFMYGIFFEEINHAGDGGLYAELIQNRSFEDLEMPEGYYAKGEKMFARKVTHHLTGQVDNRAFQWTTELVPAWELQVPVSSSAHMELSKEEPKFNTAPNNLKITIQQAQDPIRLVNEGFWGMGIEQGEKYHLRTIIRVSKDYKGKIIAKLISEQDKELASVSVQVTSEGNWNDATAILQSVAKDKRARFALEFDGKGIVWIDYVSLFPENTYKKRPNGLRNDLAQILAEMRPAFLRWPGGSIVGGITLDNRFDWKKTLGDPAARPGEYVTWGYRCSYGMGYYEMLQFCEDINAKAMFVCNVGLSDLFRSGEACSEDSIDFFLNDCLDAIEYALGDVSTEWGGKRAADGHPAPFPLEYVEIGNEHWGEEYDRRFNIFYQAIKEKYPRLTLISNHPVCGIGKSAKTDMVDPHWYGTPDFFFRNTSLFDDYSRDQYRVYVGEYACNFAVGKGNMKAALAEAAFIGGMERNGDLVTMTSYAPLLQNRFDSDWSVNLIWFDTDEVVGRSSYYVQKMASENRPDYNVGYQYSGDSKQIKYKSGKIGFGSQKTPLELKDIRITEKGSSVAPDLTRGTGRQGIWNVDRGILRQSSLTGSSLYVMEDVNSNHFTLECKARKSAFKEGIFIYFGLTEDEQKGFMYNIGCWNGNTISVEQLSAGHNVGAVSKTVEYAIKPNQWYDIKIIVTPEKSILYIDGKQVLEHAPRTMPEQFIASGIDEETGEMILKVVNRVSTPYVPEIKIEGAKRIAKTGKVISLIAADDKEENSFENPKKIYPETSEFNRFGETFSYEFAPYSYTILRVKVE